jgi:uncharacterized phiE125 gp8 family phage protein
MALQLQTAATADPVTLAEAKLHLRVDITADDALITSLITAATLDAEHISGRALMPQKWLLTLDSFVKPTAQWGMYVPAVQSIDLPRPPVTGVDSIKYVDAVTGTLTTVNPTVYQVAMASDYTAKIVPAYGQSWPSPRAQPESVQILFSTGYADATKVPEPIKTWIKLKVGALYENRELVAVDTRIAMVQMPFDSLLDRYRTWLL